MESDRKIIGAITALERENAALRRIAEELEQSGGAPGGGEELSSARIEIANLKDELKNARNEIKSLEHEYDVLYSKSAGMAGGGDSIM
jgi:predicted nuclease with TOPRIM domain